MWRYEDEDNENGLVPVHNALVLLRDAHIIVKSVCVWERERERERERMRERGEGGGIGEIFTFGRVQSMNAEL